MKKRILFGLGFGIAAASVVAVAVNKISKELKNGADKEEFDSPLEDNRVTVSCGSSETANGMVCVIIKAESDMIDDHCKLTIFAEKDAAISYEWKDNEHFRIFIGSGKCKQCCDVLFDVDNISAHYYLLKT